MGKIDVSLWFLSRNPRLSRLQSMFQTDEEGRWLIGWLSLQERDGVALPWCLGGGREVATAEPGAEHARAGAEDDATNVLERRRAARCMGRSMKGEVVGEGKGPRPQCKELKCSCVPILFMPGLLAWQSSPRPSSAPSFAGGPAAAPPTCSHRWKTASTATRSARYLPS